MKARIGLISGAAVLCACIAVAAPPTGYYDSVDDSSSSTLRQTLHDVIDDHTRYPYTDTSTDTWDILEAADEDPNNSANVLTIYRNRSHAKDDHWSSSNTTGWNREHSWPKSFGFTNDGSCNYPYTDCHHLFAANGEYNSARSNLVFNWVPSPDQSYPVDNTPYYNYCWNCGGYQDGDWEVWPDRRGDIARAQLYMDIRYEGGNHGVTGCSEPDLILTDDRNLMDWDANQNFSPAYMTFLSVLIEWHNEDPPDAREMLRNDIVYSYQGNRNPFVDHPEWVDCLFNDICGCSVAADCDDADPCTIDDCVSGSCVNDPVNCDDGDACTTDSCDSGTGLCVNDPIGCDDGDPCTFDGCDSVTGCYHDPVTPCCGNGTCESGEDCNTCPDDCISGTGGAVCGNALCEAGNGEDCANCPADCNGITTGRPSGRFCCGATEGCGDSRCTSGGYSCTTTPQGTAYCCGDGICEGAEDDINCAIDCAACTTDADCDDLDPCTTDVCSSGSCSNTPINCDDGDACTADSCDSATGTCVNDPIICDDGDLCTTDSCDTVTGCVYTAIDCNDGDPCTTDSCDPATGSCVYDPISPCCGDGICDTGEDQCSCSADCGTPPSTETNCSDAIDEDCDGLTDCNDGDCAGDPACPSGAVCGNGVCEGNGEDCFSCPGDCRCAGPGCSGCCGDGVCGGSGENASNCPVDCGG